MTKEEILEGISGLSEEDRKVLATEVSNTKEGKGLLENYHLSKVEGVKKEVASNVTSELYNSLDNQLFELTGKRKEHGVKTYDFLNKVWKEKGSSKEVEKLKEEIERVKAEKGDTSILESQIAKMGESHAEELKVLKEKHLSFVVDSKLSSLYSGLEFSEAYNEPEIKKTLIDSKIASIKNNIRVTEVDGEVKITFLDENGEVRLGENHAPITVEELKKKTFSKFISKSEKKAGGGAPNIKHRSNFSKGDKGENNYNVSIDPNAYSNSSELIELVGKELQSVGLAKSSMEFLTVRDSIVDEHLKSK